MSGTAEAGATVTIASAQAAGAAAATVSTTADADGAWSSGPVVGLVAGLSTLNITQTDAAGRRSPAAVATAELESPQVVVDRRPDGVALAVAGVPGARLQGRITASIPWLRLTLDADGRWAGTLPWWSGLTDWDVQVRYADGVRVGPATSVLLGG